MKLIFFFLCIFSIGFSQEDSISTIKRNAFPIWFLPTQRDNVGIIAIGLIGSEAICDNDVHRSSHGLNLQIIGQGFFIPFNFKATGYKVLFHDSTEHYLDEEWKELIKHNGIVVSTFGTMTHITNGLSISAWFSSGKKMNGIALNLLANKYAIVNGLCIAVSNESYKTNGIQIGLINRTRKLKGFQFGLWNVNQKRKLPLINWCFKD